MGKIIYIEHVTSSGEDSFKRKLFLAIQNYQRFGDVDLQYQAVQYYKDGATFSCLLTCREREGK